MRVRAVDMDNGHGVLKNVQEVKLKSVALPLPGGRARDAPLGEYLSSLLLLSQESRRHVALKCRQLPSAEYGAAVQVRVVSAKGRPPSHGRASRGGWTLAKLGCAGPCQAKKTRSFTRIEFAKSAVSGYNMVYHGISSPLYDRNFPLSAEVTEVMSLMTPLTLSSGSRAASEPPMSDRCTGGMIRKRRRTAASD